MPGEQFHTMTEEKESPSGRKGVWIAAALVGALAVLGAVLLRHGQRLFQSEEEPVVCLDYIRHSSSLTLRRHLMDDPCNPASGLCSSRDSSDTMEIKETTPVSGQEKGAEISGYLLSHQAVSGNVKGTSMTFTINGGLPALATCFKAGIKGTMQTTPSARYPHTWSIELTPVSSDSH